MKGAEIMSTNFKISKHRNGGNLHLKLSGDFDEDSAQQLLNVLAKRYTGVFRVIIHTSFLDRIHCFRKTKFQNHMNAIQGHETHVMFTGEYAN